MEDKIKWAVWRLIDNCSGGPSGMRAEHLQQFLPDAQNTEAEEAAEEETGSGAATEA